jgi:2-amino-4-hydroxy-6-hydroxymethyldihydropteridine diphosphokinase
MNSVDAFLSLGSNVGDREANLAQATMALSINFDIVDIVSSSYYESEPLYNTSQPEFLNSVVRCSTSLRPFDLLDVTQRVESMLGRIKIREKNQPRIIDIDILLHGDSILETEELAIPHPMMSLRKFVLIPFAEIAPNLKLPHSNLTINDLIDHCPDLSRVERHLMEKQA